MVSNLLSQSNPSYFSEPYLDHLITKLCPYQFGIESVSCLLLNAIDPQKYETYPIFGVCGVRFSLHYDYLCVF